MQIWKPSNSGYFFSSVSQENYYKQSGWRHKFLWFKLIPLKVVIHTWRMFYNALSVDDLVQKLGIPLVSRCLWCSAGSTVCTENLIHLFMEGQVAKEVWNFLFQMFDLSIKTSQFSSLQQLFSFWNNQRACHLLRTIMTRVPLVTCWCSWKQSKT